jgi:hypothetical protein
MTAERWLRRAAEPPHPEHPVFLAPPDHAELAELLEELLVLRDTVAQLRVVAEETQREADHNTQAVSPTYLRGVEQARIAARIRAALGDDMPPD